MRRSAVIAVVLTFVFSLNFASAQKAVLQKRVFSLDDCLEIALKRAFDIKLAESSLKSSKADLKAAFGAYLPSVSASAGYSRQLNAKPSFAFINGQLAKTDPRVNSYNFYANAQLPLFDGFARDYNYGAADKTARSMDLNLKFVKKNVALQVYESYIDVIAKGQIVKARKEDIEAEKKRLERIKAQYKAGFVAIDYVYSQQASLANKEYDLITAQNAFDLAKANLLALMGLSPGLDAEFLESSLPTDISEKEAQDFKKKIPTPEAAIKKALASREDFKAYEASLEAARDALSASYSGYFPKISAYASWNWSNFELAQFSELGRSSLGLSFYFPLFDGFQTERSVEAAKVRLERSEIDLEKTKQKLITAVRAAYLNLEAAENQLKASKIALEASQKNFESQKTKFQTGTATITDYLTANAQMISSKINRINAVYNYLKARKELSFAIGEF